MLPLPPLPRLPHIFDRSKSLGFREVAMIGAAFGAVAVGAFVIGALSIRRQSVGKVLIEEAEFKKLKIRDLCVGRLTVTDSLQLPDKKSDGIPT